MNYQKIHIINIVKIYSQNGEDGILEQICKELNINTGILCEFGASDGVSSSNSLNLIKKGWKGMFIEGNINDYRKLVETMKSYNVTLINDYIQNESDDKHSLNTYLKQHNFPLDFDMLSIDIDMNDYYVWKNLTDFIPKIVIIETNSYRDPVYEEIPSSSPIFDDILSKWYPSRVRCGSSYMSIVKLGLSKGYIPISYTGNIIFIHRKYIQLLKQFPYKISDDPYDYLNLYTNLVMWKNTWYTNTGLIINTLFRNMRNASWNDVINKYKNMNQEQKNTVWKCDNWYSDLSINNFIKNGELFIPDNIKQLKIDVGLSYNAPYSQLWMRENKDRFVIGFEPNLESVGSILTGYHSQNNSNPKRLRLDTKYINNQFYLIPCAIDNVKELSYLDFYSTKNDVGCSSLYQPVDPNWINTKTTVPCISLSMFLDLIDWNRFQYIEHIKVDAQGNDLRVIKSIDKYFPKIVYITVESGNERDVYKCDKKDSGHSHQELIKYMSDNNFNLINNIPLYPNDNQDLNVCRYSNNGDTNITTFVNENYTNIIDDKIVSCFLLCE